MAKKSGIGAKLETLVANTKKTRISKVQWKSLVELEDHDALVRQRQLKV
jgi:hypothetical protein